MVIKMKDLIKAQGDVFRKKHIWTEAPDDEKKPAPGGQQQPPESKKLKIDIPNSPFEPDINQVKDQLKNMLKKWKVQQYPSDEIRWKLYYKDLSKLVKQIEGNTDEV